MNKREAVCVVAIHPENGCILGATRRGTVDQWGIIGGKIDEHETPYLAALREFQEETGYDLHGAEYLGKFYEDHEWDTHVYIITDVRVLLDLVDEFEQPKIIEEGITTGFVPYGKLLVGPFGQFNRELLGPLLKFLI